MSWPAGAATGLVNGKIASYGRQRLSIAGWGRPWLIGVP
jgi:hypothetical protein